MKEIDRAVLAGGDGDMAEEPPRERLFDVLMRRLDALGPHKAAIRSLSRSAMRNPGLAFALNGLAVRSQQWMLTAADISASGPKGMLRAQGLALLFAQVLRTWVDDDGEDGNARTMAALDRALARGQRWSGFLDDAFRIPALSAACAGAGAAGTTRRWRPKLGHELRSPSPGGGGSASITAKRRCEPGGVSLGSKDSPHPDARCRSRRPSPSRGG